MAEKIEKSNKNTGIRENARKQVGMLTTAFLLGMAVNLIGLPSEVSGGARTASNILLLLHIVVAIGLVVGAVLTLRSASKLGSEFLKLARAGSIAIGVTFIAGMLTFGTKSNWRSYLMAAGFIASFWIYGRLYVVSIKQAQHS